MAGTDRSFTSFEQFSTFLQSEVIKQVKDLTRISQISADILYTKAFEQYGHPVSEGGQLADLAPATRDSRSAKGFAPNEPLIMSGNLLQQSLESAFGVNFAAIGSSEVIHAYHEFGYRNARTGKMVPPRPVFKNALEDSMIPVVALIEHEIGNMLGFRTGPYEFHVIERT